MRRIVRIVNATNLLIWGADTAAMVYLGGAVTVMLAFVVALTLVMPGVQGRQPA